ncbi:recombination regulator RecX [Streptomyces sp. MBT56]|uniref:recombination regulator RecX n=1 Tax=unclassified Streptomyces TaxID=2593676 RepID=UPI00190C01A9|nr:MULTISPECIES: recombination regulator RecX [unclassified Streptomyces]MBK3558533.1 recombination regulator RecX [Streptomyces sp. MBT56]MBK3601090.1 recombination regulator RecX [Streptomyces sp. MBT54]MBK3616507.1 recombination regulator RecX [Streptomyces sp. MBT98]MBK6041368.1 recombination regulator RecX [Streptomyces sp. MBT55]
MTRRTEWPDSPAEPGGDAGSGYGPTDASAAARGAAADDVGARSGRRSRGGAGAGSGFGEGAGRRARSGTRGSGSPSSSRAEKGEPRDPVEQARNICLRLLTGTPRTRKQLADALRKREIPDEAAEEVLARFEDVGLIDDAAFAGAWVESRHHGRGLARRALVRELRTKGVDSAVIDEAVGQLDPDQEEETARELVARKLRSTRGLDRDKRLRRLAGMLARKGYGEGMALRVVRQALEEEGEDTEGLDEPF